MIKGIDDEKNQLESSNLEDFAAQITCSAIIYLK